jgi:hypothetical protein
MNLVSSEYYGHCFFLIKAALQHRQIFNFNPNKPGFQRKQINQQQPYPPRKPGSS